MKIGIFSQPGNDQATTLQAQIDSLAPSCARHYAMQAAPGPALAIDTSGVYWNGDNIAELDLAYIHGFAYSAPVIPPPLGDVDWSVWQVHYLIEQQRYSFLFSAFRELQRRGVRLVNPPDILLRSFMKLDMLERLRQGGLRVPRLVCTNDADTAQALSDELGQIVWRPATGRASWQLFLDKQRLNLMSPRKPPVLLAEIIDGPLIRAYLFRGEPMLLLQRRSPARLPLETLEAFQLVDYPELTEDFQRFFEQTGIEWAQLLCIYHEGRVCLYDVDVDPIISWLPETFRQRLTAELIARFLDQPCARIPQPVSDQPAARPTLFLRRMLGMLFDFEQIKYHQPVPPEKP